MGFRGWGGGGEGEQPSNWLARGLILARSLNSVDDSNSG